MSTRGQIANLGKSISCVMQWVARIRVGKPAVESAAHPILLAFAAWIAREGG